MSRAFKQLKNFFSRSVDEKRIALEALLYLIWIKYELYKYPFSSLVKKYALYPSETTESKSVDELKTIKTIGWAVSRLSERLPWKSLCLVQAMSVQRMLARRQISSVIYLGVAKEKNEGLKAHAWVKYGEYFIVGKVGHENFTIVSKLTWKVEHS